MLAERASHPQRGQRARLCRIAGISGSRREFASALGFSSKEKRPVWRSCGSLIAMTSTARALEVGFRWERLTAHVDIRWTARGKKLVEAAGKRGRRVPLNERHKVLAYSFSAVRQTVMAEPGIYLIEAFHTEGRPGPDPGSMPKEYWSEVVDYYTEMNSDPDYNEPIGQDPLWFYIGMTRNFEERFKEHEQRASALTRTLQTTTTADDVWMRVSLQRGQCIKYAGNSGKVDLSSDLVRVLFEHAGIADYRQQHPQTPMVNIEKALRP